MAEKEVNLKHLRWTMKHNGCPKTLCNHLSYKLNYPHFLMNTILLGRITENYDYSEFIVCLADIFWKMNKVSLSLQGK